MDYIKNNAVSISPEDAMRQGEDYYYGRNGKTFNIGGALKYFNIPAKQNNPDAEFMLGTLYFDGICVSKNLEKAVSYFEKASTHNHAKGSLHLARCYEQGLGVSENREKAILLYKQAAKMGETEANFVLARLEKSIAKPTNKKAHFTEQPVNTRKDISAEEAIILGDEYYFGKNGKNIDFGQAIKYYNIAAKQKNADAEYKLGTLYFDGICVTQSYEKAIFWFEQAAFHKHAKAHLRLAQCYEKGLGVPQDHKKALSHYEQASISGEHDASLVVPRIKEEIDKLEHERKVNAERVRKEGQRFMAATKQDAKNKNAKTEPEPELELEDILKSYEDILSDYDDYNDTPDYESSYSDYSSNSYSGYTFSSYSPSSYDSDRYAREQAEEAKTLAREAQKQTDLIKRQMEESKRQMQKMEHEAKERRLDEDRRIRLQNEKEMLEKKRQKEEAIRREQLKHYEGIIYFKGGRTEKVSAGDRRSAERMAQQRFEHAMKIAINDQFKPTRYEVIEVYPW